MSVLLNFCSAESFCNRAIDISCQIFWQVFVITKQKVKRT